MTWQEHLTEALQTSAKVATLDFETSSTHGKNPAFLLRESRPHEEQLYLADESITSAVHQKALRTEQRSRNPQEADITRVLDSARSLATICNMETALSTVDEYEQRYEDITADAVSLQAQLAIREAAEKEESSKAQAKRGAAQKMALAVKAEEEKVQFLQRTIYERRQETDVLVMDLEQYRMRQAQEDQVDGMQDRLEEIDVEGDGDRMEKVSLLKERIELRRKEMEDLDREEEELDALEAGHENIGDDTLFGQDALTMMGSVRCAGRIRLGLHGVAGNEGGTSTPKKDAADRKALLSRIERLVDDGFKTCQEGYERALEQEVLNYAHQSFVDMVANDGRVGDEEGGSEEPMMNPPPSRNFVIAAIILQTLMVSPGPVGMAALNGEVGKQAEGRGWNATHTTQAVHTLMSQQLVDMSMMGGEFHVRLR